LEEKAQLIWRYKMDTLRYFFIILGVQGLVILLLYLMSTMMPI